MGVIVKFPHHVRMSAGARAAKSANNSAVKPALRARSVRKSAAHHSAGILFLWGHLRAASTPTPISAASRSGDPQSATISRKLEIMDGCVGQSVQKIKANLSRDSVKHLGHAVPMDQDDDGFALRLREIRGPRSQEDMAELLGVTKDAYAKWENRGSSPPRRLLPRIWKLGGVTPEWLLENKPPKFKTQRKEPERRRA